MDFPYLPPMFENNNDALVPEIWAQESLMILEENMVVGNLVHRDFENKIAAYGDVVNTRKPNAFEASRKTDNEDVVVQDAISTNIPVPLNQHWYVSFTIKDGEESKSFQSLVAQYLRPQALAIAQAVDRVVSGRVAQFAMVNRFGSLSGGATDANVLGVRKILNNNKCPMQGRNLVLTSDSETDLLALDKYSDVDRSGSPEALRQAFLGQKRGFDIYMAQNMSSTLDDSDITTTTVSGAVIIGASTITVASGTGIIAGAFISVAGTPYRVTNVATAVLTVSPTVDKAIANGAAVKSYDADTVNQASTTTALGGDGTTAGYRSGWHKAIVLDVGVVLPEVGALVSFGTSGTSAIYSVVARSTATGSITLDRPVEVAIADGAACNRGPTGSLNFAFHRNACAMVTRPLVAPRSNLADSYVASYNGLGIRVVVTYEGRGQGHLVTADLLMGVATLDTEYGAVLLA